MKFPRPSARDFSSSNFSSYSSFITSCLSLPTYLQYSLDQFDPIQPIDLVAIQLRLPFLVTLFRFPFTPPHNFSVTDPPFELLSVGSHGYEHHKRHQSSWSSEGKSKLQQSTHR